MQFKHTTFGDRLRQIRRSMELSQTEFAEILGTSKQALSRYETNKRAPKITIVMRYAEKLGVTAAYMLGEPEELHPQTEDRPASEVFAEIIEKMKLDIYGYAEKTGLSARQIRAITERRVNDAPFLIAWQISEAMGLPLEVFAGEGQRSSPYISLEAREIALAFDQADMKCRALVRMALDLTSSAP